MTVTPGKVAAARAVQVSTAQPDLFGELTHCAGCGAVLDLCGHCRACEWHEHRACNAK